MAAPEVVGAQTSDVEAPLEGAHAGGPQFTAAPAPPAPLARPASPQAPEPGGQSASMEANGVEVPGEDQETGAGGQPSRTGAGSTSSLSNHQTAEAETAAQDRQALARLVRQHEEEVFMQHFHRWILAFSLIVCLATPAMVSLLVWLVISYLEYRNVDCDVPLRLWVYVVCVIVAFNSTVNRPTPTGSCVQRVLCRWSRDPHDPQPMPLRVRAYNLIITVFVFAWNCAGLHWISTDSSNGQYPSCREAAPTLYVSVKVYAAFNLAVTVFMYVNMFGFAQLLRVFMRRGLLHTSQAAPSGSLEKNTEVAKMSDAALAENPTCPVCLEEFEEASVFVKTKACGHFFHKQCLKGWLNVNRTCPLCREDLGTGPGAPGAPPPLVVEDLGAATPAPPV